jgi:death-on-curing protein
MTERPAFLTVEHVLAIHGRVIADFGGDPAVRDQGLLESAVMMPAARYGGELLHPDLPAMAAAYLFHICRNHPFVDGNKRTALVAAEVFLLLNGWRLRATNRELERMTLNIAEGKLTKDEVVAFLRGHAAQAT